MPIPHYRMAALLALVRHAANTDFLARLHFAIEHEIAAALERITNAERGRDQNYLDAMTDDECEHVEELMGLAFVAAQSFITSFRTRLAMVATICKSELGILLTGVTDAKGYEALKLGKSIGTAASYTAVEAINAVANYWKHQDDWPTREERKDRHLVTIWDSASMRPNEKRTVEIVTDLGMLHFSTGNLRVSAKALGVTRYEDFSPIRRTLRCWADELHEKVRQEASAVSPNKEA
jgi:hypothetical protein